VYGRWWWKEEEAAEEERIKELVHWNDHEGER